MNLYKITDDLYINPDEVKIVQFISGMGGEIEVKINDSPILTGLYLKGNKAKSFIKQFFPHDEYYVLKEKISEIAKNGYQ